MDKDEAKQDYNAWEEREHQERVERHKQLYERRRYIVVTDDRTDVGIRR